MEAVDITLLAVSYSDTIPSVAMCTIGDHLSNHVTNVGKLLMLVDNPDLATGGRCTTKYACPLVTCNSAGLIIIEANMT